MSTIDTDQRVLNESWRATPDTMMAELTNGLQYPPPHLQLLGHLFWLSMTGAIPKLSISVPPGHAKSQLARWSCAWALDHAPTSKIIYACYGKALAEEAGKYVRGLLTEHESRLRVRLKKDSQASDRWQTTANGGMWSAGIRSGVTGRRASCVVGGTMITTEIGPVRVEDLVEMTQPPRILTFNHATNTTEWADILAFQVSESDSLVELKSDRGITLRCTTDHRVYDVQRGYREAGDFDQRGTCYIVRQGESLSGLRGAQVARKRNLFSLLYSLAQVHTRIPLLAMRHTQPIPSLRINQASKNGTTAPIYFVQTTVSMHFDALYTSANTVELLWTEKDQSSVGLAKKNGIRNGWNKQRYETWR